MRLILILVTGLLIVFINVLIASYLNNSPLEITLLLSTSIPFGLFIEKVTLSKVKSYIKKRKNLLLLSRENLAEVQQQFEIFNGLAEKRLETTEELQKQLEDIRQENSTAKSDSEQKEIQNKITRVEKEWQELSDDGEEYEKEKMKVKELTKKGKDYIDEINKYDDLIINAKKPKNILLHLLSFKWKY